MELIKVKTIKVCKSQELGIYEHSFKEKEKRLICSMTEEEYLYLKQKLEEKERENKQ